ncbi:hypothetical protein C8Q78DRAFT_1076821 [Trametes maxima]|nr:hypothetical protein C8Q78DRAFT_1076821 [Trametes maxima]
MGNANKYRLYLVIYDNNRSAGPGSPMLIHWALLIGTKHEDPNAMRKTHCLYHATNTKGYWRCERHTVECVRTSSMLGRVFLGKINPECLATVDHMLADPRRVRAGDPRWDCWAWVEEALADVVQQGLVQIQAKGGLDLRQLKDYGWQFATEIVAEKLDSGHGIPVTVDYPGPGRVPAQILNQAF